MSQKIFDGAAMERSGAGDVAGSMSAVSGTVKALCRAGDAIAVSVAAVTSEQHLHACFMSNLELTFLVKPTTSG